MYSPDKKVFEQSEKVSQNGSLGKAGVMTQIPTETKKVNGWSEPGGLGTYSPQALSKGLMESGYTVTRAPNFSGKSWSSGAFCENFQFLNVGQ